MSNNHKYNLNKKNHSEGKVILLIIFFTFLPILVLSSIFSKYLFYRHSVEGIVTSCESLDASFAEGNKVFSFSIEIETPTEAINFSAEDRKWKSVHEGDRVKAIYYEYAFWKLDKAGTYYNGRLIKKLK